MKRFFLVFSIIISMTMYLSIGKLTALARVDGTANFSRNYTLSGNGANDIVAVARAQLGKNGGNLGYSAEEWCADFVSDCAILAGQSSAIPANARCDNMQAAIKKAGGDYISPSEARVGDILFYGSKGGDHVEIVYAQKGSTLSTLSTIGGNSGHSDNSLSKVKDHPSQGSSPKPYKVMRPNYSFTDSDTSIKAEPQTILDGDYYLISSIDNKASLDIPGNNGYAGANVHIWPRNDSTGQLFRVERQSSGYYHIIHKDSGLLLEAANGGTSVKTNVQLNSANNSGSQDWVIVEAGDEKSYYIKQRLSGLCLDINTGSTEGGTNVQLYKDNGSLAERFFFRTAGVSVGKTVPEGDYVVACDKDQGFVMSVDNSNGATADGTNVHLYKRSDANNQIFTFKYLGNGLYNIIEKKSGCMLDAAGWRLTRNGNAQMWGYYNTNEAGQWIIKKNGNAYNIINWYTGLYLDLNNGNVVNGENIHMWSMDNLTNEKWHLISVTAGNEMFSGFARYLPDGDYQIISAANPDSMLDIVGNDVPAPNGKNVRIWETTDSIREQDIFTIKYSDGFYSLRQKNTNASLDVQDISMVNDHNVQIWQSSSNSSQKWAIANSATTDGYALQAKCSGFYLTVDSDGNVIQRKGNGTSSQSWRFIPYKSSQPIENGRYVLTSAMGNKWELDVAGDSGNIPNGQNVQLWNDDAPSEFNAFDVVRLDDGYYKLIHAASGKALTVADGSYNYWHTTYLWDYTGDFSQQWAIIKIGDHYSLWARCSGYVLDVRGGSAADGSDVGQYPYRQNNTNQLWDFAPAKKTITFDPCGGTVSVASKELNYKSQYGSLPTPVRTGYTFDGWYTEKQGSYAYDFEKGQKITSSMKSDLKKDRTLYAHWHVTPGRSVNDGEYYIASALDESRIISVNGANTANGSILTMWHELWPGYSFNVSCMENGYYKLMNMNSSRYMDIEYAAYEDGSAVTIYGKNDNLQQQFIIRSAGDGYYYIIDRNSEKYLTAEGGNVADGTKIIISSPDGSDAQKWRFIFIENKSYHLVFDANGGKNAPEGIYELVGSPCSIPEQIPEFDGYSFYGWRAVLSDGSTRDYKQGDLYDLNDSRTVWAIWGNDVRYDLNGGNGKLDSFLKEKNHNATISSEIPVKELPV